MRRQGLTAVGLGMVVVWMVWLGGSSKDTRHREWLELVNQTGGETIHLTRGAFGIQRIMTEALSAELPSLCFGSELDLGLNVTGLRGNESPLDPATALPLPWEDIDDEDPYVGSFCIVDRDRDGLGFGCLDENGKVSWEACETVCEDADGDGYYGECDTYPLDERFGNYDMADRDPVSAPGLVEAGPPADPIALGPYGAWIRSGTPPPPPVLHLNRDLSPPLRYKQARLDAVFGGLIIGGAELLCREGGCAIYPPSGQLKPAGIVVEGEEPDERRFPVIVECDGTQCSVNLFGEAGSYSDCMDVCDLDPTAYCQERDCERARDAKCNGGWFDIWGLCSDDSDLWLNDPNDEVLRFAQCEVVPQEKASSGALCEESRCVECAVPVAIPEMMCGQESCAMVDELAIWEDIGSRRNGDRERLLSPILDREVEPDGEAMLWGPDVDDEDPCVGTVEEVSEEVRRACDDGMVLVELPLRFIPAAEGNKLRTTPRGAPEMLFFSRSYSAVSISSNGTLVFHVDARDDDVLVDAGQIPIEPRFEHTPTDHRQPEEPTLSASVRIPDGYPTIEAFVDDLSKAPGLEGVTDGAAFIEKYFELSVGEITVPTVKPEVVDPSELQSLLTRGGESKVAVNIASSGQLGSGAIQIELINRLKTPVTVESPGVVLEPVEDNEAQEAAARRWGKVVEAAANRGVEAVTATVNAYCLEFMGLPPPAGALFQIAAPETQVQFAPVRIIMDAARRLHEEGSLNYDGGLSEPEDYFHSIRQWSAWTELEGLDFLGFVEAFVDQTRKNFEAAEAEFSPEVEGYVRDLAEPRWTDIQSVLKKTNEIKAQSSPDVTAG